MQDEPLIPEKDSFYLKHSQIMLGSKSGMIVPATVGSVVDIPPKPDTVKVDSFFLDESQILGSSKSAYIHRVKPVKVKLDTGKKKQN
jgi:hypothetical protein